VGTESLDEAAVGDSVFRTGEAMRRRVLGDAYVDSKLGTDPTATPTDFQRLLTEFGWGVVWSRPQLEPRVRSMLTVAMLIALNRPDELRVHMNGALRNGVTEEELREQIIQSILYCGFPAAVDASRVADAVISARAE
jgi:4-carboxymuconolactone decarboxylase